MGRDERATLWIAHNYSSDVGFAWRNISALFNSIAASLHGHNVSILMSYASSADTATPFLGAVACRVVEFDFNKRGVRNAMRAFQVVRTHQVRYVYLTDQPPTRLLYGVLRLAGVRSIVTHNRISVANPSLPFPDPLLKRSLKAFWARLPFVSADRVYAVSDFVAKRLTIKARVPLHKVVRIYNGIDTKKFAPSGNDSVVPGTIFIGCRADPHKGIDVLIDACHLLRSRGVVFQARYAGDGPAISSLKSQVARLGLEQNFIFLGELKSVADEVRRANVVTVPSNWGEALGSAVVEAMACGKPVIATRAGGIPEIIEDSRSGILVQPGDASALADAIETVLCNPSYASLLGQAARERATSQFDIHIYHRSVVEQLVRDFRILGPRP